MKTQLNSERGAAFITTIVFTTMLFILVASIIGWSVSERRNNALHDLRFEARNAAESLAEYGAAQLQARLGSSATISTSVFDPSQTSEAPIAVPKNTSNEKLFRNTHWVEGESELVVKVAAPVITPGGGGSTTSAQVLARATTNRTIGGARQSTAYVSRMISIVDQSIFRFAIFYNMDMEIAPGPEMNVYGKVHSNGDLWLTKQSANGAKLKFWDQVSAEGVLYKGFKTAPKTSSGGTETANTDPIEFLKSTAYMTRTDSFSTPFESLKGSYGSLTDKWRDTKWDTSSVTTSTLTSFQTFAADVYGENLKVKTSHIGLPAAELDTYEADPTPSNGTDNSVNTPRALIERPLTSTDTGYISEAVEAQKMSRKSGMYIMVNGSSASKTAKVPGTSTTVSLGAGEYKAYKKNSDGSYTEIKLPGQTTHSNPTARPVVTVKSSQMTDLRRNTSTNPYDLSRSSTSPYVPKSVNIIEVDMTALKMAVEKTVNNKSSTTVYGYDSSTSQSTYRSSSTSSAALTDANNIEGFGASDWNGAVYIESVDAESHRSSGVRLINGRGPAASADKTVHPTKERGLSIATNDALYVLGHLNSDGTIKSPGSTAPTDAQLGDIATTDAAGNNSALFPDSSNEVPVALIADAVTILSNPTFDNNGAQNGGWSDALSDLRMTADNWKKTWATTAAAGDNQVDGDRPNNDDSTKERLLRTTDSPLDKNGFELKTDSNNTINGVTTKFTGKNTEVSAAFLVGLSVSNKNGSNQNSGGVHNLPRFLEKWDQTCSIRGSMVVMFESRVANEPWGLRYYGPPTRLWGFHNYFRNGEYPPQTPFTRSYIPSSFAQVSAAQYDTLRRTLWPSFTFPTLPQ